MQKYEVMCIVKPDIGEESMKALMEKCKSLIAKDGEVQSIVDLGKKTLAYPILGLKEANFLYAEFTANPAHIAEIDRVFNITDEIIKHMVTKKA